MLVKAEEVGYWARTPIYTEMFTQHKDTVAEIQRTLLARSEQSMPATQDASTDGLASIEGGEHVIRVKTEAKVASETSPQPSSQSAAPIMISNPIMQRQNLRGSTKAQKIVTLPLPAALNKEPLPSTDDSSAMTEGAEEESFSESEPEDVEPVRRSAKGKSVLRPRTSTIPLEVPSPLAGRSSTTKIEENEEMMDFELDEDTKPSNKRPADEDDVLATPAERLKKRYRAIHAQPRRSQSLSETPSLDPKLEWPALLPGTGKSPIEIGHMPPTSSSRPGGAWVCSVPNCKYKLLEGDSVSGRALIEAHYESHARVMQNAMDIIGIETQAARGIYHVE